MHSYDVESANGDSRFGLAELNEEPDSDDDFSRKSFGNGAPLNGAPPPNGKIHVERIRTNKVS